MAWPLEVKLRIRKIHKEEKELKSERKRLQLELTLEQLCDQRSVIHGNYTPQSKETTRLCTVHQPSTADHKRIEDIQVRLNQIYRELFHLTQEKRRLTSSRKLRPVLRWGKFLSDVELHWI